MSFGGRNVLFVESRRALLARDCFPVGIRAPASAGLTGHEPVKPGYSFLTPGDLVHGEPARRSDQRCTNGRMVEQAAGTHSEVCGRIK